MGFVGHFSLLLVFFLFTGFIAAVPFKAAKPTVQLDYGLFVGAQSSSYNVTYFRKIPFAASTAGRNRFRAPQPPPGVNGTYNTDQTFDMCPQRTINGSEDCLYLGVYSRPWSTPQPLRPVLLTFYGGGFIRGSAAFTIPPSGFPVLNVSTTNDYIVIYSNYRTNLFGFLAGTKIQSHPETDLNAGLLDQRAALDWIQKYVHHFGGDKSNVTIWGQSAGGGSVVAQTIAEGNRGKKLFSKALDSSPFWPKTYRYDSSENEELYQQVVKAVGCKSQEDEVECLKKADLQALRDISLDLSSSHQYTTSSFTWGPVIDDKFFSVPLSSVIARGELNAEMVMSSYNLHEGENFIPPGFFSATGSAGFNSSSASFDAWIKGFLPGLSSADLAEVKKQYPAAGEAEEIKWSSTYERAGLLFRDLVLACPAYWLANTAKKGFLIEYTISPAKHASDVQYWNTVGSIQKTDPLIYTTYAGAMASFIQTGDPNAHKVSNSSIVGVPGVKEDKQFVIRTGQLAQDDIALLEGRCKFWLGVAEKVPI